MKKEEIIYINLIQKIAIHKTGQSNNPILNSHIVMLDWVLHENESARDIREIIEDKRYTLKANEYMRRYSTNS